jgi:hypothetical protein
MLDKLETGVIRGISGTLRKGRTGKVLWLFRGFCMVAPPVSVKNGRVRTRGQVLNVPITY